jgi:hypothetical protein
VGKPRARWLVSDGPAAIVAGRELPPMPEVVTGDGTQPVERTDTAPARPPVTIRLSRALLLVPLLAVAIISFVVIRAQHGSGATILTQQRYAQRLTAADVVEVVRTAPDPKTRRIAIRTRCVPLGIGDLKNPWRCQLTYANRDHLQYTVTIFGNGGYEGVDQIILGPGPRRSSSGSISGCCINIP